MTSLQARHSARCIRMSFVVIVWNFKDEIFLRGEECTTREILIFSEKE